MIAYDALFDQIFNDVARTHLGCRYTICMHPETFHGGMHLYLCTQRYRFRYQAEHDYRLVKKGVSGWIYCPGLRDPYTGEEQPIGIKLDLTIKLNIISVVDGVMGNGQFEYHIADLCGKEAMVPEPEYNYWSNGVTGNTKEDRAKDLRDFLETKKRNKR
jgi:hypothetical protein